MSPCAQKLNGKLSLAHGVDPSCVLSIIAIPDRTR